MKTEANLLKATIQGARPALEAMSEDEASGKAGAEIWSKKEILGHLIDSAANNHQRFVRLQQAGARVEIQYAQEFWVSSQRYQTERWEDLVSLWYFYNLHLSHVVANMNPSMLGNECEMGYAEPKPLSFVVQDYLRHMEHHLRQILSDAGPEAREKWEAA